MKDYYKRKRDEANAEYLAACEVEDEQAKAKWLTEFNNYDKECKDD